jgi:hypothetical protein
MAAPPRLQPTPRCHVGQEAAEVISLSRLLKGPRVSASGFENVAGNTRSSTTAETDARRPKREAEGRGSPQLLPFKRERPGSASHPLKGVGCRVSGVGNAGLTPGTRYLNYDDVS